MRQRAQGSVEESLGEIDRLEDELAQLADEMQDEIDRIADLSEEKARAIEEVPVRPHRTDVEVDRVLVVWGTPARPPVTE
jgi:chromosome segregation ATPase